MTKTTTDVEQEDPCAEVRRGRGRPQARCDEETRAVIFDAARHEFAASGYAATSIESVARRAGVSTKTLYRLIPNKAALFEAMITNRIDTFASVVRVRACDGSNIKGALREALVIWGELILDGEVIALQRLILADGEKFPEIAVLEDCSATDVKQSTLQGECSIAIVHENLRANETDDLDAALLVREGYVE